MPHHRAAKTPDAADPFRHPRSGVIASVDRIQRELPAEIGHGKPHPHPDEIECRRFRRATRWCPPLPAKTSSTVAPETTETDKPLDQTPLAAASVPTAPLNCR